MSPGFRLWRMRWSAVLGAITGSGIATSRFHLGNRIRLFLRRQRGHAVVVTPPDPDAFPSDLQSRLDAAPSSEEP